MAAVGAVAATVAAVCPSMAFADLPGADGALTRAPYLTDPTQTSVQVTWATTTQSKQTVKWGPPGSCTANTANSATSATLGNPIAVGPIHEFQNSVAITGLTAGTSYCYRIFTGDNPPVDLLGSLASPSFTTPEASGSSAPFTFDVLGDFGDTTNSGANTDGTLNANQAGVDAQIAASGARFAVSTGDIAYPSGSQTNYGDVNQTGPDVSAVFGPSYWTVPGQTTPLVGPTGNHGQNKTFLSVWPSSALATASNGVYQMVDFPTIDGASPGSYPTTYYAFTTGNVRFYVLDASWADGNVGSATGGACGTHCAKYQVDHDAHWTQNSDEYKWLAQDLAAHPGGLKFAAFHFPLRSDDAAEPDDAYLQNVAGNTASLEQLLHDSGVDLVFNGHAHIYQRNVAPPGGVPSYVTGGGGARLTTVSSCKTTDAYAIGWSYTSNKGSKCGAATAPTSDSQVFHFLKVTVNGDQVTVTPTDSGGNTFDVKTWNFAADSTAPSAPASLVATLPSATKAKLTWGAATDNLGVVAYDIYRDNVFLATVTPATLTYTDATVVAGSGHTYRVDARDQAGNVSSATASVNGGGVTDSVPPNTPTGLTASSPSPTAISLSWTASTDNVGVSGYDILRGGQVVATVTGTTTSYIDNGLTPATAYSYTVQARDAAGNVSGASNQATATTPADTTPPTAPGTPVAPGVTSNQVPLSWTPSTDNVGVARYDIVRDGSIVGTSTSPSFTDTTVAPGGTYTYAITAYDTSGNSATSPTLTVGTPISGAVFSDGFESGSTGMWNPVSGLLTQQTTVHTGSWAARETSAGTATYAYKTLPTSYSELWAQAWVYVSSKSTSVNIIGFRTSGGGSIINLYVDTSGRVSLRNNVGGVTTYGQSNLPLGGWHRLVLHAVVNGTSSSTDVSMDGVSVPGLSLTGQNLGTTPISKLQLGETSTGRTYDVSLDDVAVSTNSLG